MFDQDNNIVIITGGQLRCKNIRWLASIKIIILCGSLYPAPRATVSNLVSKVIIVELLKNRISRKENKKYEIKRRKAFLVFLGHLPFTALTFMFFIFTFGFIRGDLSFIWWYDGSLIREVVKKRIFYGQADCKGCPPAPLQSAFCEFWILIVWCVQKSGVFWSKNTVLSPF